MKTPFRKAVGRELKNLLYRPIMSARSLWMTPLGALMPLRLSFLGLEDRRRLVAPTLAIGPLDGPENLLQVLQFAGPEVHAELDSAFGEIFEGLHIKLDDSQRVQLTLRVAASIPPESTDPIQNVRQLSQIRNLAEEGDAYQSVAAVLMAMLLGRGRVLLLDQPSAFLQPEQARRLGRWLARGSATCSCQVFVATRDADLLQGLFDGDSNVTVLRVSRRENLTRIQPVPQEQAAALANTPLLACQEGLRLLLRDGVIVTPNETTRIFYQTVTSRFTEAENIGFVQSIDARNMGFITSTLGNVACLSARYGTRKPGFGAGLYGARRCCDRRPSTSAVDGDPRPIGAVRGKLDGPSGLDVPKRRCREFPGSGEERWGDRQRYDAGLTGQCVAWLGEGPPRATGMDSPRTPSLGRRDAGGFETQRCICLTQGPLAELD